MLFFFFKQKTAYEMRISDWSSDVCSSDLAVGVMDMLRFDKWTAGRYWVDDYGSTADEAAFRTLHAYSPYHNIQPGRAYPAILATTADTDDRAVPAHTSKHVAALHYPDHGATPPRRRIATRARKASSQPHE